MYHGMIWYRTHANNMANDITVNILMSSSSSTLHQCHRNVIECRAMPHAVHRRIPLRAFAVSPGNFEGEVVVSGLHLRLALRPCSYGNICAPEVGRGHLRSERKECAAARKMSPMDNTIHNFLSVKDI